MPRNSTSTLATTPFAVSCLVVLLGGGCAPSPRPDPLFTHCAVDSAYAGGHISAQDAGDIDGDGYADIVIRSGKSGPGEIAAYHNPGDTNSAWSRSRLSAERYPDGPRASGTGLAVYDVDADGWVDVVAGAKGSNGGRGLFWWRNPGAAHPTGPHAAPDEWTRYAIALAPPRGPGAGEEISPHDVRFADLDADRRPDLLVGGSSEQGTWWARVPADPARESEWTLLRVGPPRGFAFAGLDAGDVDGDGRVDVVRSDVWYRATGPHDAPVWEEHAYGLVNAPPSNVVLVDIDGDPSTEIVVASGHSAGGGQIVVYRRGRDVTARWRPERLVGGLSGPENLVVWRNGESVNVVTAELDFRNHRSGRRRMLRFEKRQGATEWTRYRVFTGPGFHMMRAEDFDNDGDLDLYAASFTEANGYAHVDIFENRSR